MEGSENDRTRDERGGGAYDIPVRKPGLLGVEVEVEGEAEGEGDETIAVVSSSSSSCSRRRAGPQYQYLNTDCLGV